MTLAVDMPLNSSPVTTNRRALEAKRQAARDKLSIDVGFYGGLVPGNEGEIEEMVHAGVLGIKAFLCPSGIDEFPAATERELRAIMPLLAERGLPLLVHAELVSPTPPMSDPRCYADYLVTRPPHFERDAIGWLIDLCRETACRIHVVHLADGGSLDMLKGARGEGLPITVETCPHYLYFASETIPDAACEYKCAAHSQRGEPRPVVEWIGRRHDRLHRLRPLALPAEREAARRRALRSGVGWHQLGPADAPHCLDRGSPPRVYVVERGRLVVPSPRSAHWEARGYPGGRRSQLRCI